jgi:hypothetical protein
MNLPGSEAKKKLYAYILGAVALIAVYYIYSQLWGGSTPAAVAPSAPASVSAPAAQPVAGGPSSHAAKSIAKTAASLDPTLHMERMRAAESVIYDGSGRNIFSSISAPVVIPKPVQSARLVKTSVPVMTGPAGPPPPPPIDLRFCGYFASADGHDRKVILVHGDDVVLARPGDVVLRRYKLLSVSPNSIQVEDLSYNNRQTLPLLTNP